VFRSSYAARSLHLKPEMFKSNTFTVQLTRSGEHGLGMILDHDDEKVPRVWVDALIANSPAMLSGKLAAGDRLARIGGKDVRRADVDDVLEMLAQREKLKLTFVRPLAGSGSDGSAGARTADQQPADGGSKPRAAPGAEEKELFDARAALSTRADELHAASEKQAADRLAAQIAKEARSILAVRGAAPPPGWESTVGLWEATCKGTDIRLSLFENGAVEVMMAEYPSRVAVRAAIGEWGVDEWGVATLRCECEASMAALRSSRHFGLEMQRPVMGARGRLQVVVDGITLQQTSATPRVFHKSPQCRRTPFTSAFGPVNVGL